MHAFLVMPLSEKLGELARVNEPTRQAKPCSVLGDVTGDPGHGVHDVSREERESAENGDRDHGQHDAVLRHRLPVFALKRVEKLQHLIHLPSSNQASPPARQGTTTCGRCE